MKTAEEWEEELFQSIDIGGSFTEQTQQVIKQIQLDAWKQGMTDAADAYNRVEHLAENPEHMDLRVFSAACQSISKRMRAWIIKARDERTTI